ncbi:MAG TPA: hypothetical protein VFZ64_05210, partial [Nocardioidaceae bacterium]
MTVTTNLARPSFGRRRRDTVPGQGKKARHLPPGQAKKDGIAYFGWCFDEGSSQEDIFVADPIDGAIARITDDSHNPVFTSDRDPAWSPDRKLIAIHRASETDQETRLYLLRASTGRTVKTLVPGWCPEWYDDHTLLFLRGGNGIDPSTGEDVWWTDVYAVDVDTLAVSQVTDFADARASAGELSWHPVAGLAFGLEEPPAPGQVRSHPVVTVAAPRVRDVLAGGPRITRADLTLAIPDADRPDWSPDGARLVHNYFTEVPYPDPSQCEPGDPCTMLAADIAVTDMASGTSIWITSDGPDGTPYGDNYGGQSPVFSPDGAQVAFTRGNEDEWQEIWLSPSTHSAPVRLTDEGQLWFKGG